MFFIYILYFLKRNRAEEHRRNFWVNELAYGMVTIACCFFFGDMESQTKIDSSIKLYVCMYMRGKQRELKKKKCGEKKWKEEEKN